MTKYVLSSLQKFKEYNFYKKSFYHFVTLDIGINLTSLSSSFLGVWGPASIVGIATGYALGGRMLESQFGLNFPGPSRLSMGPTPSPLS